MTQTQVNITFQVCRIDADSSLTIVNEYVYKENALKRCEQLRRRRFLDTFGVFRTETHREKIF